MTEPTRALIVGQVATDESPDDVTRDTSRRSWGAWLLALALFLGVLASPLLDFVIAVSLSGMCC